MIYTNLQNHRLVIASFTPACGRPALDETCRGAAGAGLL
jgi:hypothetical protein